MTTKGELYSAVDNALHKMPVHGFANMYLEGEEGSPVKITKIPGEKVVTASDQSDVIVDLSKTYMFPHDYLGRRIMKVESVDAPEQVGGARRRTRRRHSKRKTHRRRRQSHRQSRR